MLATDADVVCRCQVRSFIPSVLLSFAIFFAPLSFAMYGFEFFFTIFIAKVISQVQLNGKFSKQLKPLVVLLYSIDESKKNIHSEFNFSRDNTMSQQKHSHMFIVSVFFCASIATLIVKCEKTSLPLSLLLISRNGKAEIEQKL